MAPDFRTAAGRAGFEALQADPAACLVAFDYDGTLAPIVPDPSKAVAADGMLDALSGLAARVGHLAIITGRPAAQAVELGGFATVPGLANLTILGHYGAERWKAGVLATVDPPPGLAQVRVALPALLDSLGLALADIEDKGLSIAVHVRQMPDPGLSFAAMLAPLEALAGQHGLVTEPGRLVVELRPPGVDKGQALTTLVGDVGARSVVFVGDDLGDLAAFEAVVRLRETGVAGVLVCSGSDEVTALADLADVVVDGPTGVIGLVLSLSDALTANM